MTAVVVGAAVAVLVMCISDIICTAYALALAVATLRRRLRRPRDLA